MLAQGGEGLWLHEEPLRLMGIEIGSRMVVRLVDGGLFVHSPADLTPELRAALDQLGPISFVVGPTAYHGHAAVEAGFAWLLR